jgi:radical SAM superfamily enzyme YgiQ (UPF0313 family)
MNVTLIYPLLSKARSLADENKQYWPPLGLAYIGSVLRQGGHRLQIIDRDMVLRKNGFDFEKADRITLGLIEDFRTEAVGFSLTTPNVTDGIHFSSLLKKANPRIMTVFGGPHCTGEPVTTLNMAKDVDVLVRGEGEMAMLDLANGLSFSRIEGLSYRNPEGTVVSNPDRPLIEPLDSLPLPARDLLDMDYYTRPSRFISRNLSLRATHIFTARGCPNNCYYCAGPLMGRRKVRFHSPQRVVSEIEELIAQYRVEAVYFAEDMFLSSKKRALEMVDLFLERGIHKKIVWMAQLSTSVVDEMLLARMKEAGCVHVEYGFESGSQRILNLMNKRASVETNRNAALLTKKSGLRFQGNFIAGFPGETEDDFKRSVDFMRAVRPNNIALNIFMPLPGTQIHHQLKEEGKLLHNWDDLGNSEAPFVNYAAMPPKVFEKLYFRTKLRVVLPLNLYYFLKDNIFHPLRLFYVIFTQFKSVIKRMFKAVSALRNIKRLAD